MKRFFNRIKNSIIKVIIGLSRGTGLVKEKTSKSQPSRFLIVSTTGIGDTLWGTPAIRALKETYPDSYIGLLTTSTGAELLKGNPYIDSFFIFRRGLRLFSLLNLLKKLRRQRFDMAFIFHASDRVILPLIFYTGSQIIGIIGQNKGLDFVLSRAIRQEDIHAVNMRLRLVKEAGARTSRPTLDLYLTRQDREDASRFLRVLGCNSDRLTIGLHPGAQKPFKCWPAERFIETGNWLVRDRDCRVIITGNMEERALCKYIASRVKGAISIAGRATLRETAAIIEGMKLFITNDTGPMHIAFALRTPTVALFCPTEPKLCGPVDTDKAVIIKKPLTCDPCKGKNCLNPLCMNQITVQEVLEAAQLLLNDVKRYERHVVQ